MNDTIIKDAFILAAGMGSRLRPYTDHCPKPMVKLQGRPIIDHVLDRLGDAGVERVTVNLHYMADILANHLVKYRDVKITLSYENELLNTGFGIKNALPVHGKTPFYVVSGDSVWSDGSESALKRLANGWKPEIMDLLLLQQPLDRMHLTPGLGDYNMAADGQCVRSLDKQGAYMWTSVRVCTSALFADTPDEPFSFLKLMDQAQEKGRLYGLVHEAEWYHITTPDDLDHVNAALAGNTL